jgi:rhamnulose-1-phosphate aldolase/alcohol dehydrogenase
MTVAEAQVRGRTKNLWDQGAVESLTPLQALRHRSNLLGSDRAVANFGGGNTSVKARELDHTGRESAVLWVKGSGSDLATMKEKDFTGLRLDEMLPLIKRDAMSDEEMVAYLSRCQIEPGMPRSSIETLLHAFIPFPHVDHTHADATNMIACASNGERLARECFGDAMIWIPYIRPGFTMSKQIGELVKRMPQAKLALLAKHGLVTWGDSGHESYTRTINAINQAADFVAAPRGGAEPFGGPVGSAPTADGREDVVAAILPTLRGAVSQENAKILVVDTGAETLEFVRGKRSKALSQVGAACPDHLIRTKMRPLWIDFDPADDSIDTLKRRLVEGVREFADWYRSYFARNQAALGTPDDALFDPYPRVVLIQGLGLVGVGQDRKAAMLSRDFYHRAIPVIYGADTVGEYVSLSEEESFAVEYWPMELYKLKMAPRPKQLAGRIALVTGGSGGIGQAAAAALAAEGACVVVADLDGEGAERVAADLNGAGAGQIAVDLSAAGAGRVAEKRTTHNAQRRTDLSGDALGVRMDVADEKDVKATLRTAVLAYGGVDIVVSNAGLASSAPIEETSIELWNRNYDVLAKGYFLVSREAFTVLRQQGMGGSIVFVASKNALAPGKNASAYSSAKAAELHLARCLAEEGGACGIRVNCVNPDAVIQGSKIWDSAWREERAQAYGIKPEELEDFYRQRNTLKVSILPEDVARAILFFASSQWSGKSTGNILNVDGGVPASYPR